MGKLGVDIGSDSRLSALRLRWTIPRVQRFAGHRV